MITAIEGLRVQDKADEERERTAKETIHSFLQKSIVPKIRLRQWSMPIPLPEPSHLKINWGWPHWSDLNSVAEKFWKEEGYYIKPKKKRKAARVTKQQQSVLHTPLNKLATICFKILIENLIPV